MAIHTVEISRTYEDCASIQSLMAAFGFSSSSMRRFFFREGERACVKKKLGCDYPDLGLKFARAYRWIDKQTMMPMYTFTIKIEPQMLLSHHRTVELYRATPDNNRILRDEFHIAMNNFVDDSDPCLVDLWAWNCGRIDYTHNIQFETEEDGSRFLALTKKTSKYIRNRRAQKMKGIKAAEQSTAEANKSSKVLFYGKRKQIKRVYVGMPEADLDRLLEEATGTIRFENQCKYQKINTIKNKYGFGDRSIEHFLDERIARDILSQSYDDTVGFGTFYSSYWAKKHIMESDYGSRKKKALYNCMRVISLSRSVYKAKMKYAEGSAHLRGCSKKMKCTKQTFTRYLNDLEAIGVNPVMIPKNWNITVFENPIDQIIHPAD